VVPGVAVETVVLAHRAPLALAQVRAPLAPPDAAGARGLEPLPFLIERVRRSAAAAGWRHVTLRSSVHCVADASGFPFSAFEMSAIAFCARTLLPASSSGGETTATPTLPGETAMMPPPTPLFAGSPV